LDPSATGTQSSSGPGRRLLGGFSSAGGDIRGHCGRPSKRPELHRLSRTFRLKICGHRLVSFVSRDEKSRAGQKDHVPTARARSIMGRSSPDFGGRARYLQPLSCVGKLRRSGWLRGHFGEGRWQEWLPTQGQLCGTSGREPIRAPPSCPGLARRPPVSRFCHSCPIARQFMPALLNMTTVFGD